MYSFPNIRYMSCLQELSYYLGITTFPSHDHLSLTTSLSIVLSAAPFAQQNPLMGLVSLPIPWYGLHIFILAAKRCGDLIIGGYA